MFPYLFLLGRRCPVLGGRRRRGLALAAAGLIPLLPVDRLVVGG